LEICKFRNHKEDGMAEQSRNVVLKALMFFWLKPMKRFLEELRVSLLFLL